jgi:hypothetical protein
VYSSSCWSEDGGVKIACNPVLNSIQLLHMVE